MNVATWHVHGSWSTAFVAGAHRYLVPVDAGRTPDGRGRARTWDWPDAAVEVTPSDAADEPVDVLVAQRLRDLELFEAWFGRRPGRDVPLVYVEHNTPPAVGDARHPLADRDDAVVVHVTHFNQVVWDCGSTPTVVIEHGVPDPGHGFVGDVAAAAAVVNEPLRRGRAAGADLLGGFAAAAPLDVFGMGTDDLGARLGAPIRGMGDVPQAKMLGELGRRRCYVHPFRWTSLGLSLVEAMLVGLPVVAVGATAAFEAVPAGAGLVSTRLDDLHAALRRYVEDPDLAAEAGRRGRAGAIERFGLDRFLRDWDRVLEG
jgi:hypothetical protein